MMGRVKSSKIPVSCNKDCGGVCPLLAHVEEGRVVKITRNPAAGRHMQPCVRASHLLHVLYAPERLRKPLIRTGPRGSGQFREARWPEALDLVAVRLAEIKSRYGNEAVLHLGGSGSCYGALHNTDLLTRRFLSLSGGYTTTRSNYSTAAADFVAPFVLGTKLAGIDAGTLEHSNLIILWGANISDTRLGCEMESRIRQARERDVDVVVIDPRYSNSADRLGTQWLPVRPGTDVALMMAVLHVLLEEGLVDRAFVNRYSTGFEHLEGHVLGLDGSPAKTPQWAEALCGTPADQVVALAIQYGSTRPAALVPGLSIQRTVGGEEAIRMAIALQVATGNLGVTGGSSGALTWGKLPRAKVGRMEVPPNPCRTSVPVVRWPDAILEGKAGGYPSDIKVVYNVGGNYLVQGSDTKKSMRAFEQLEFAVCHDLFLTPTARYCDVVLPTTTSLERDDILVPGDGNYLLFSNRAVRPAPECRTDYDIFCELADRLGFHAKYSYGRSAEDWLKHFLTQSEVTDHEEFRRTGIYMGKEQSRVGLSEFVADPRTYPLNTPSGRVEISSLAYDASGFSIVPQSRILETTEEHPLRLVTPHPRFRIHSQLHNISWFRKRERHVLWIHPTDAQERGIGDGQQVLVRSPQGSVRVVAWVTEDIMPGVVSLTQGVWPKFDTDGVDSEGAANVLTSTEPTLPSYGTRTHSVLVQVERLLT